MGAASSCACANASASRICAEPGLSGFCWLSCGAQPVIQAIIELAEVASKEPWPLPEPSEAEVALKKRIAELELLIKQLMAEKESI